MEVSQLEETLEDESLRKDWEEIAEGAVDDPSRISELVDWIKEYRDETLEMIEDVQDPDEIHTATVLRYVEAKCHWMIMNTHMQYQAVNTGQPERELMVKGSLMSNFIETLEEHLDDDKIDSITELLSQPVSKLQRSEL